jgi:fluoroquinolone transport system ATP-binding protein
VTTPVIDVEDLCVRYPKAEGRAVDGMSFTVEQGEIFGFLGPNGAGKSTTQKVLTQLLARYEGRVAVLGRPLGTWGADYRERIGVCFELPASFAKLTAAENLLAFASLYARPVADPVALLEEVGLADHAHQRVGTFSKGMQMRLNLARALVNDPTVLFLDEPTSGLDPVQVAQVRDLVRRRAEAGATVFLTSHDMASVDALCHRVAFVTRGRIAAIDTPRRFKVAYGRATVSVARRVDGGLDEQRFSLDGLRQNPEFLEALAEGGVESIHTDEAGLAEVFVRVTGEGL